MDHRAHHLRSLSHSAVAKALASGRLTRQPCEACGEKAQAHHDSYHPDCWLDVRWLCGSHHRLWHQSNEADYPSIFEFHPTDIPLRKGGRPSFPWVRTQGQSWYVTMNGKKVRLGRDREEAFRLFEQMVARKKALESAG